VADEGTLTDNAALSPLAVMRPDPACISLPTASERAMLPHQPAWWEMRVREQIGLEDRISNVLAIDQKKNCQHRSWLDHLNGDYVCFIDNNGKQS
jgi:hypothetical protein